MPEKYLNITIGKQPVDVGSVEDFPISVNYSLEDPEDFQKKTSDEAFNVKFPATLQNRKVANSFHNPGAEDLTAGQAFRSHQPAVIEADGEELLNGKAFLKNATHSDVPEEYEYDFYGGNGDWIVDLKEATLYDFLSHITFEMTGLGMVLSWNFDGRDEKLPYVFAPVRYRGMLDADAGVDTNVSYKSLRPALSKYWLLYWGFKSLGYRIQSDFFDTDYFRRQVMPWTWGNFIQSEGTQLDVHRFLAKSASDRFVNDEYDGYLDTYINDTSLPGVYDNNNEFSYVGTDLIWEYKAPDNGRLDAFFTADISTEGNIVGDNSYFGYLLRWFYVPVTTGVEELFHTDIIFQKSGANLSAGIFSDFNQGNIVANHVVNLGDKIIGRPYLKLHVGSGIGARVNFHTKVEEFKLAYFHIPPGGTISFANYTGFKKFKFLDFVAGVFDEFNISVDTDQVNKIVFMEPTHNYTVDAIPKQGFFTNDYLDWNDKLDLSKKGTMTLYSDYEKEVTFRYKDDTSDGILKVVQDRNQNVMASGKYLFPDRFKAGKREHENRFFAPTMHADLDQFKGITGIAPQMICIVPENISNTSNSEADNTFTPKSAYYKGLTAGVGGWRFEGMEYTLYPFMFAVNYKDGGENDPILSYSDEKIGSVVAQGLMKKFFSQRLAIMRNGQYYDANLLLKNVDVKRLHREHKIIDGQRWELVAIKDYTPLKADSTACSLRKWSPVVQQDFLNSFPSNDSVLNSNATLAANDIKYAPLKCLLTDIPK